MNAATLFAVSPNSIQDEDFKDFEKVLDKHLCMPIWTYDKLEKCWQHVFLDLSKESLVYIYGRVGGVPRSYLLKIYYLDLARKALAWQVYYNLKMHSTR